MRALIGRQGEQNSPGREKSWGKGPEVCKKVAAVTGLHTWLGRCLFVLGGSTSRGFDKFSVPPLSNPEMAPK